MWILLLFMVRSSVLIEYLLNKKSVIARGKHLKNEDFNASENLLKICEF